MLEASAEPALDPDERSAIAAERLAFVRAALDRLGARSALLRTRHAFAWMTVGGSNHVLLASEAGAAPILVTPEAVAVLAPINEAARIRDEEVHDLPIDVREVPWSETPGITDGVATDEDLEPMLLPERSMLTTPERRRVAWLGARVRNAMDRALAGVSDEQTEVEATAVLCEQLWRAGARTPVALAAADERIDRYRHPLPTDRRIERRLMLVVVAERWGLHVALTGIRELEDLDPEQVRRREAAADVLRAMRDATRPGATLGDVLAVAQEAYARTGFPDEWRLHHQGGSIGYRARERIAVPGDPTAIRPGMAFAWNPSITGTKVESTWLLEHDGRLRDVTDR